MGEVSVKERFNIKEDQVLPLLQGKFDLQAEIDKLHAKGKILTNTRNWLRRLYQSSKLSNFSLLCVLPICALPFKSLLMRLYVSRLILT